jgi:hypothetical protein
MPHRPRSQPWPAIHAFYADLARKPGWEIEPMVDLVRFIQKSPYAHGLFPYTSPADLHVGRVANFACGDNELTIVYDMKAKTFKFTYRQREDDLQPWSTECSFSDAQNKLIHVLQKRLHWFHES